MKQTTFTSLVCILFAAACLGETRLTPEQFGAKGDGIADDTAAIQKCIDQIAALAPDEQGRKGSVVLDKVYYVTRQAKVFDDTSPEHKLEMGPHWRVFHVPSGVTIEGQGTVTLLQNGQSSRENPTSYTYMFWVSKSPDSIPRSGNAGDNDRVSDVTIRGISVISDPASLYPPYSESSGINIKFGVRVHVENVKFRHWHRAVAMARPIDSSVTGCMIEDTRYIGIALYGAIGTGKQNFHITGNTLRGNTQLSGGIYAGGSNIAIEDNTIEFTHGIFAESLSNSTIRNNRISRSPYAIRGGYLASGSVTDLEISGNTIEGCAGGIMLGNAAKVSVAGNTIGKFIPLGSDIMIEPPNGYWGFGRERMGINVEDSSNVSITQNVVSDLNEGTPVGIRVANSRFTIDFAKGCYDTLPPAASSDNPWNIGNQVTHNRVSATSGLRISYYIENQVDFVLKDNESTNDSGGRVIASTGSFEPNQIAGGLKVVKEATAHCRRLITENHPMHWKGMPSGGCAFAKPAPPQNEYFPPLSAMKDK